MTAQPQTASDATTFSLERFAWDSPDRLEVSGWFADVGEVGSEPPTLLVEADDTQLRLPAVPERAGGPPRDGRRWWAAFAWEEAPADFEHAVLELGELTVELPQPQPRRAQRGDRLLEVRRAAPAGEAHAPQASDRLALQAALVLAQEEIRGLRGSIEQVQRELQRARADVELERGHRSTDSERFRDGLQRVRRSAEEAIAAERETAREVGRELGDARGELTRQAERLAELERAARESRQRRAAIEEACGQAEQLLAHLSRLRDGQADEASA